MDVHEAWVRGKSISEIARLTGRDRKTIRRLLREGGPKPRAQREVGSKLDAYRQFLLSRMLGEDPVSNAEVLFDEIREMGYNGGRSILKEFLHPFRQLAKEKTTVRFETPPGKQAQVDWGTFQKPERKRVQGFVMTLGWSRTMYLDFNETQALASFLGCHEEAFHYFGGVPEEILYDRTKTVWLRDDERGDPIFHPGLLDFAQHYGFQPRLCRGYRPQTKGKTENGIGYVRKNFWPRVRDYRQAHDLLGLRRRWLDETCNVRVHGTPGERPVDRLPLEGLRPAADIPAYRALVLDGAGWHETALSVTPAAGTRPPPNMPDVRSGYARPRTGCSSATATGSWLSTRSPSGRMSDALSRLTSRGSPPAGTGACVSRPRRPWRR